LVLDEGDTSYREEELKAWLKYWKDLSQERIQGWIERIPIHIQEIIRLRGNEYKEGKKKSQEKRAIYINIRRQAALKSDHF